MAEGSGYRATRPHDRQTAGRMAAPSFGARPQAHRIDRTDLRADRIGRRDWRLAAVVESPSGPAPSSALPAVPDRPNPRRISDRNIREGSYWRAGDQWPLAECGPLSQPIAVPDRLRF